ncbi:HEPN domain-containing protein [Cognatilysobacter segetis]|uniref:HEPN domain-containing protein n=1 Tax=Cognatilysobacter segetis TaxID=2492394 RepID=UPI0010601048|nr:HEPN domain-containing protein [Lysobacter segetis]
MSSAVAALKEDADGIKAALGSAGELSLIVTAEDVLRRSLLIAAASAFEHELGRRIDAVFTEQNCSPECLALIRTKAISRQFYTYFDFDGKNTNKLFIAFGGECKDRASAAIRASEELKAAQDAFLEICRTRNAMVHTNFAAFTIELSSDEIYDKYKLGLKFVDFFEAMIRGSSGATLAVRESNGADGDASADVVDSQEDGRGDAART